jgi:hypothetical protein
MNIPKISKLNYTIPHELIYDDDYRIYQKINEQTYRTEKYFYDTFKFITRRIINSRNSMNYFNLSSSADIGWVSGIIVDKSNSSFLENITIEINGSVVCRISIKLLIKLYSFDINNNLLFIPIPKKSIIINKQNIFDNDINHSYGIPLNELKSEFVKIYISATRIINYCSVVNYTKTLINSTDQPNTFLDLISMEEYNMDQHRIDELKNNKNIILLCIDCCKEYCKKNKTIIHIMMAHKMLEFCILPNIICELVVEYACYFDIKIIIYDKFNYYLVDFNRLKNGKRIYQTEVIKECNFIEKPEDNSKNEILNNKKYICDIL